MTLSLTTILLLWFFSPALPQRARFYGKVMLAMVVVYELSRIAYHAIFDLT